MSLLLLFQPSGTAYKYSIGENLSFFDSLNKSTGSSTYVSTVLSDNPILYWQLNETSGTIAYDTSTSGISGAYGSTVGLNAQASLVTNVGGQNPVFPSYSAGSNTNNIVSTTINTAIQPASAVSLEFWMYLTNLQSGSGPFLVAYGDDSGTTCTPYGVWLQGSGNYLALQFSTPGAGCTYPNSSTAISTNTLYHVVLTVNSASAILYLNGNQILAVPGLNGSSLSYTGGDNTGGFVVNGEGGNVDNGCAGTYAHVAIYSTALASARIAAHYATGMTSEFTSRIVGASRGPSEALSVADNSSRLLASSRTPNESMSISDTTSRILSALRNPNETIGLADIVSRVLSAFRSSSEAFTMADGVTRVLSALRSISETETIADVCSRVLGSSRSLNETLTITDTVSRLISSFRTPSETLTIGDTVARIVNAFRSQFDILTISDAVSGVKTLATHSFSASLGETLSISDTASRVLNAVRSVSENLSIYDPTVLVDLPEVYYKLNEISGTTAVDVVSGFNGSYIGSPTLGQTGLLATDKSTSVSFNGTTQYLASNSFSASIIPTTFTFEAWIKTTTASGGGIVAFQDQNTPNSAGSRGPQLWMENNGSIQCNWHNGTSVYMNSGTTSNDGNPHHIVWTFNTSTSAILYVDGVVTSVITSPSPTIFTYSAYILIGGSYLTSKTGAPTSNYFNGSIEKVAIYPTALSQARVLAHYNAGKNLDIASRLNNVIRNTSETLSIAESSSRLLSSSRTPNESIGFMTDTTSRVLGAIRTSNETLSISDTIARIFGANRSVADILSISDTSSRLLSSYRNPVESLSLSDSIFRIMSAIRTSSEALTVSDTVSEVAHHVRSISEALSISDLSTRQVSGFRSSSEALTFNDAASGQKIIIRNALESTLTCADVVVRTMTALRSSVESLTIADNVSTQKAFQRLLTDAASGINDAITRIVTNHRSNSEVLSLTDSATRLYDAYRLTSETLSIADTEQATRMVARMASEVLTINDALQTIKSINRAVNELIPESDNATRLVSVYREVNEILEILDSVNSILTLAPLLFIINSLIFNATGILSLPISNPNITLAGLTLVNKEVIPMAISSPVITLVGLPFTPTLTVSLPIKYAS